MSLLAKHLDKQKSCKCQNHHEYQEASTTSSFRLFGLRFVGNFFEHPRPFIKNQHDYSLS